MADKTIEPAAAQDCVEPELLHNGGRSGPEDIHGGASPQFQALGLVTRLKRLFACGLALLAFGLFAIGALLTSTIIGALIGVPLMLSGALLFYLLFRLLSPGYKNFTFSRRF